MELTSDNVEAVTKDCVYTDWELPPAVDKDSLPADAVVVEGVINTYAFNPERLEQHRDDVKTMIEELPRQFFPDGGGGWSFLNLCTTQKALDAGRGDEIWTGLHLIQERLYCLAAGLGMAKIQVPRELWGALPGGVPYMTFSPDGFEE